MKKRFYLTALILIPLALWAPRIAVADDEPASGVARVSLIDGDVSVMRGDSGDWVATTINAPLVPGDQVSTGSRSRVEIQLDYANTLRLSQNTEAKIADLTRSHIQVQVASGMVSFTVLNGNQADVEIDTPNMAVHPTGEGNYRIQVNSPSDTQVTVRRGQAGITTPQGNTTVESNQTIFVQGTDNPEYRVAQADPRDEWDQWNNDRDRAIQNAGSYQHTNRYYTGAQDLDRYGHWVYVPNYDWCWTPYVDAGWVPYRVGRYVWEPGWGWTWVSYEPWGWAPYHYGRWFYYGDNWCWWPGAVGPAYYPTWGPAYVSFFGFGFGGRHWSFGFGFGFNSIGWCPLGPLDPVYPWWGRHNTFNVVNITNITNINNRTFVNNPRAGYGSNLQLAMNNVHVRRAITTVPTNDFVAGRIPRSGSVVSPAVLRQGQVVQGTPPVVPTRASLSPVNRSAPAGAIRQGAVNQHFFSNRPAASRPEPFQQRAAQIQQMVQTHNPMNTTRPAAAATGNAGAAMNAGRAANQAGFGNANRATAQGNTPFGRTNSNTPANRGQAAPAGRPGASTVQAAPTGGWQRFGRPGSSGATMPGTQQPSSAMRGTPQQGQSRMVQPAPRTNAPSAAAGGARSPSTWQTFGGNSRPAPSRSLESMPRGTTPPQNRPAPSSSGTSRGGWQTFTPQSRPAPAQGNSPYSAPRPQSNNSGWSRFSPQSSGRSGGWASPAPRPQTSYSSGAGSRPPLELRKPIITERAPSSYGGGGSRGWSAPSGGSRSWSAPSGGNRGGSAPSGGGGYRGGGGGGGGHSAPAPSSHGGGGGGHSRNK